MENKGNLIHCSNRKIREKESIHEQTERMILSSISTVFSTGIKNSGSWFCKVKSRSSDHHFWLRGSKLSAN